MADIHDKIFSKYGIDINSENIFKLYKLESADISHEDLDKKIQETRKRWTTSINGANEKNAERDKVRLEKADKYETILKNENLRKEIYNYYNKSTSGNGKASGNEKIDFAKEYFELIATTKKIKKDDVEFFFKYYPLERKNKKEILEMLKKEMKISGLGKEDKYEDEPCPDDEEEKKKNNTSPLIVNLFKEATVLKIRRAIEKYEEAIKSNELCQRYPKLQSSLYDYLEIKDIQNAKQFKELMSIKGKEIYSVRQEHGTEYVPLVDLFNILQSLADYQDVIDNIPEFKLLLKYPNLTPYMFSFVEMKPSTIKGIVSVAKKEYSFRNETDFILNYYKLIHDNFGINDVGITSILRNAEKKAKQNKVLNDINEKLGRNINKRKKSFVVECVYYSVYWPIFIMYLLFEVVKLVFSKFSLLAIPIAVMLFIIENWLFPNYDIDNMLNLRKIFFAEEWHSFLETFLRVKSISWIETFLLSILVLVVMFVIYIIPPLFIALFINEFSNNFNKRFDWVGIERTFQQFFIKLKKKTEDLYNVQQKAFLKKQLPKIIINIVCLIIIIAVFILGSRYFMGTLY